MRSKVKKSSKQPKIISNPITTSNRFSLLQEEKCFIPNIETNFQNENRSYRRKTGKWIKKRGKKAQCEKILKFNKAEREDLKVFETPNRFKVLEDTDSEDLEIIVETSRILKTPKSKLGKCRRCHYKKRTCAIDLCKCQALQKLCRVCK